MARRNTTTTNQSSYSHSSGQSSSVGNNTSQIKNGKNTSYEVRPDEINLDKINELFQKEGKLIYDKTLKVLKYWNGTQWISATNSSGGGAGAINVVQFYDDLPLVADASGLFYFVTEQQGTRWLPGSFGGQYFPQGLYYSNGIAWKFMNKTAYRDIDNYFTTSQTVDGNVVADSFIGDGSQLTNIVAYQDTYYHDQGLPSATWVIEHNLGKKPGVAAVDTSGKEVIGNIDYISNNKIQITFNAPFSGQAYLN
jgi:hypothetical protein